MTNCEQFLEYQKQWGKAASSGDEQKYKNLLREAHKFRDENFTRDDWNELINQSSGRARFEYKRIMNEKFPVSETPNGSQMQGAKMTKCEQYLDLQKQWSDALCNGDNKAYDELTDKGLALRDTFSRDDWDELISQSSGHARFEYERMKNAKFSTDEQ